MDIVAKFGVIGDSHLSSNNYGGHSDYPNESIRHFKKITELTEELRLTHLIGAGDLTYGKFSSLDYRTIIEEELEKQNKLTNGNRYELKGNHDSATNGMTEYEFYVKKGMLKPATHLKVGSLNLSMLDYKKSGVYTKEELLLSEDPNVANIVIAHNFFKFKDTNMANFGDAIILDNLEQFYGVDYLILGHVHHIYDFKGNVIVNDRAYETKVQYLGCPMRPSYIKDRMDKVGQITVITVYSDGRIEYDTKQWELPALDKCFNIEKIEYEEDKKTEKQNRLDISNIIENLDSHQRNMGDPEQIIDSMSDIDKKYREKAKELLKRAVE